jgi:hypothetical protein
LSLGAGDDLGTVAFMVLCFKINTLYLENENDSSDPEVGGQSTISLRNVFFLFSIFLQSVKNIAYEKYIL